MVNFAMFTIISNHQLRNKTKANLSKQIITIDEISVLGLGLTFCPTVKMLHKEQTAKDFSRYIRRVELHKYFYGNTDKSLPENPDETLLN